MLNQIRSLAFASVASLSVLQSAHATEFRTQDNIQYNIAIKDGADFASCATQICQISREQGSGDCHVLAVIGIVSANLTWLGVQRVEQTECASAIEADRAVPIRPCAANLPSCTQR